MSIEIVPYTSDRASDWDVVCARAVNATMLHTTQFLSYHGSRFKDVSTFILRAGNIVGVFPAAESRTEANRVISHPGLTYGGVIHRGTLTGTRMLEALAALSEYYARKGYSYLEYKAVPYIYASSPAQDDLYALFRLGAKRVRCDLSCTIDLAARRQVSERRRRGRKKAERFVTLSSQPERLGELWRVVEQNLEERYRAKPVHSLSEIVMLRDRFPDQIAIRCALIGDIVEAGLVLFNSPRVWHAQYIAATPKAYDASALDAVIEGAIVEASQQKVRYFDFGTSNEMGGMALNDGLYRFKSEFGGGGVVHEFYEMRLG